MIDLTLCDGSVFSYEPEREDTYCDECGHVTGQRIINEPSFHGKIEKRGAKHFCTRCNEQMSDLYSVTAVALERVAPAIEKMAERSNVLYEYYSGRQR